MKKQLSVKAPPVHRGLVAITAAVLVMILGGCMMAAGLFARRFVISTSRPLRGPSPGYIKRCSKGLFLYVAKLRPLLLFQRKQELIEIAFDSISGRHGRMIDNVLKNFLDCWLHSAYLL